MTLIEQAKYWNVTSAEKTEHYPCDDELAGHPDVEGWLRAVDVDAPVAITFRWLCQFKIAPYSYDWIDNIGRRSPRRLTVGIEDLAVDQRFLVFRISGFAADDHITGRITPGFARMYGDLAVTYRVRSRGAGRSRVVVKLTAGADTAAARLRRRLLSLGDMIMMRRQLLNLRDLAESTAGQSPQQETSS